MKFCTDTYFYETLCLKFNQKLERTPLKVIYTKSTSTIFKNLTIVFYLFCILINVKLRNSGDVFLHTFVKHMYLELLNNYLNYFDF